MKRIIEWIQKKYNSIFRLEPIAPHSAKTITYLQLQRLLKELFPTADIYLSDKVYLLCDNEDVAAFLAMDKTNRQEFVAEKYDCDDFAYRLMGQYSVPHWSDLALGLIWTDKHAMNYYVDESGKLWYVEPQNDTVADKLAEWQGTRVRMIMI